MHIVKTVLIIAIALSICLAQKVSISGIVTDTGGTPIEGAVVMLEKCGYTDTTGADGNFMLTDSAVGINNQQNQSFSCKISASIKNNLLCINVTKKSALEIITFNIQGKAISSIRMKMTPGIYSIKLPRTGSGVYFHRIKTGSNELMLKSNSIGTMSFGIAASAKEALSMTLAKRIENHNQVDDVIKSTKPGYLNYRVIVTNSDTSGIQIKMISQDEGTVADIDGNVYHAIRIGNQVWTAENLRTTKYNDGSAIPHVTDSATWSALSTPGYCYYNNTTDTSWIKNYGALYNWYTIGTRKLAPTGWHVPTDSEWNTFQDYLITNGYNWDGSTDSNKIAKSLAAKVDWPASTNPGSIGNDLTKNNSTGFSALPGGYRSDEGDFPQNDGYGSWWTGTEYAFGRYLGYKFGNLYRPLHLWNCGFSVRLVKD